MSYRPTDDDIERQMRTLTRWCRHDVNRQFRKDMALAKVSLFKWCAASFLCGAAFVIFWRMAGLA